MHIYTFRKNSSKIVILMNIFKSVIDLNSDNLHSLYSLTPLLSLFVSSLFTHTSHLITNPLSLLPHSLPPSPPPAPLSDFSSPTYPLIPHPLPLLILSPHSPLIPPVYPLIPHAPPLTLFPRPSSLTPTLSPLIPQLSFLTPHEG